MAETHQIEIKNGKVKVTVTGVKGQACKAATERLQGLGHVVSDVDTNELYEEGNETVTAGR
jgi:hypothetical protein